MMIFSGALMPMEGGVETLLEKVGLHANIKGFTQASMNMEFAMRLAKV